IASFPQRHGQLTYRFIYDTPTFKLTEYKDPAGAYWDVDVGSTTGWRMTNSLNWQFNYVIEDATTCPGTGFGLQVTDRYEVIDPDGPKHPLALRVETGPGAGCPGSQLQSLALDGSGIFVDISSSPARIVLKDGTQVSPGYNRDTNGNITSTSSDM